MKSFLSCAEAILASKAEKKTKRPLNKWLRYLRIIGKNSDQKSIRLACMALKDMFSSLRGGALQSSLTQVQSFLTECANGEVSTEERYELALSIIQDILNRREFWVKAEAQTDGQIRNRLDNSTQDEISVHLSSYSQENPPPLGIMAQVLKVIDEEIHCSPMILAQYLKALRESVTFDMVELRRAKRPLSSELNYLKIILDQWFRLAARQIKRFDLQEITLCLLDLTHLYAVDEEQLLDRGQILPFIDQCFEKSLEYRAGLKEIPRIVYALGCLGITSHQDKVALLARSFQKQYRPTNTSQSSYNMIVQGLMYLEHPLTEEILSDLEGRPEKIEIPPEAVTVSIDQKAVQNKLIPMLHQDYEIRESVRILAYELDLVLIDKKTGEWTVIEIDGPHHCRGMDDKRDASIKKYGKLPIKSFLRISLADIPTKSGALKKYLMNFIRQHELVNR